MRLGEGARENVVIYALAPAQLFGKQSKRYRCRDYIKQAEQSYAQNCEHARSGWSPDF